MLIDPLGAIITVIVFQALSESRSGTASIALQTLSTIGTHTAIGLAAAAVLVLALARYLIPDELQNAATLAVVIVAFAAANEMRVEAGLVAVTVMEVALASQSKAPVHHVLEFNETLRILFIVALFVLLGARIRPDTLRELEWRNLAFLATLVMVIRPACVFLATVRSGLSARERVFLSLTARRGIVAAAVASVFSLQLADLGVENSQVLMSVTFTVIGGTVLLVGLGSEFAAVRLGLVEVRRDTIIVLGANPVARQLAEALERQDTAVRLVDLDRHEVAAARMSGLPAHLGSVFADETLEDAGIRTAAASSR